MGIKIAFNTRTEAREFKRTHGGDIRDCKGKLYLGKRWVVYK